MKNSLKGIALQNAMHIPGDLVLILAGTEERTRKAISELRLEMGEATWLEEKR